MKKIYILIIIFFFDSNNILINILFCFNIFIIKKLNHNILIEIDTSTINSPYGPGRFLKEIYKVLPFFTNNCCYIPSSYINFFFKIDYYYIPFPKFKQRYFEKLVKNKIINKFILGPNFVPKKWDSFPDQNDWKEKRFSEILNSTKGIAVHSQRIIDYLAQRTKTINMVGKYKIIRACTNLRPKILNSFEKRNIDIIFFEKYSDLNRSKQAKLLLSLFKTQNKKIISIKYGFYKKKFLKKIANDSKFIIYFSFYDTGAIGLKEIQNYGVYSFTHQKELVISNETSFWIPELANIYNMQPAFNKIINIIETITLKNPNSQLIAKKNQIINNCKNALKDLCEDLL